MIHARRVDGNQAEVVAAIQKIGGVVTYLYRVGEGVADLLVSFRNTWTVFEVKRDARAELKETQVEWIGKQRAAVHIVTSGIEAVTILLLIKP